MVQVMGLCKVGQGHWVLLMYLVCITALFEVKNLDNQGFVHIQGK